MKQSLFDVTSLQLEHKKSTKGHTHDCLTFLELLTINSTITQTKVLTTVKGKLFVQFPHSMKIGVNIRKKMRNVMP